MYFIDYLNIILKYAFINLTISYLFLKMSNLKLSTIKNKLTVILSCIIISIILTAFSKYINPSSIIIISYVILTFLFNYITKHGFLYTCTVTLVSLAITIILYVLSIITSLFMFVIILNLDCNNPIILLSAILIEVLLVSLIFSIKRFKNGLSFFHNITQTYDIAIFLSGIVILIFSNLGKHIDNSIKELYILGLLLIIVSIFIWIKRKITIHYKELLKQDSIQNLQDKLNEQIHINEIMKDELEKLSIINHKFSSRISALELYVKNLSYNSSNNIEINNSILEAKKLTQSLSAEFSNEMHINLRNYLPLNKTGITNIDNILEYFEFECMNKNISFNVIVKSNIEYEVKRAISLNLLETLISDMLNNAIIAINHNTNKNNKILVQFDMCDYLEIRIYDTGIEFEINTLVKLGKEQITTHKSDGGSGIGFITTFETLNKTNGSLIIEEYKNDKYDYSKCLIFKFDNKKQFIIRSYRADEIKELSNNELIIQPSL